MDPKDALQKIRTDEDVAKKFREDPWGTLEGLGVDTEHLKDRISTDGEAIAQSIDSPVGMCGLCDL